MSAFLDEPDLSPSRDDERSDSVDADWVEVAALDELRRRKRKLATVGAEYIALFLVGDHVYALRDVCIHKGRQLSKGTVLRGHVICPGHQWQFDLETGWVSSQERCQPTYAVKIEDNRVYIYPRQRVRTEPPDMVAE